MRTTVRLDDSLYRDVKKRAAASGRTVAAVLEEALRIGMETNRTPNRSVFKVQSFGGGTIRDDVQIFSNASVLDVMDDGVPLDALR